MVYNSVQREENFESDDDWKSLIWSALFFVGIIIGVFVLYQWLNDIWVAIVFFVLLFWMISSKLNQFSEKRKKKE